MRVVREISDMCKKGLRWYYTAIVCLQGALEDYLIEYFNDVCILAAHGHRITIMIKDFSSLGMLRYRYEN